MGLGDVEDDRVLERARVLAVAVERDTPDWRPGLGQDAVPVTELLNSSLLEVGVDLDLVDGRHDRGAVQQPGQVLDHEVADSDGADLAVLEQRLKRAVGRRSLVEVRRQRLVQDQQVDLVEAQLPGALVETVQGSRRSRSPISRSSSR